MGDDFRIRRRLEYVAFAFEPRLQRLEVLDHAVVTEREHALAAEVRMGVPLRRRAVRRPARVADANRTGAERWPDADASRSMRPVVLRTEIAPSGSTMATPALS